MAKFLELTYKLMQQRMVTIMQNTIGCFAVGLINDACSLRFLLLSQLTDGLRIAQMIDYTGIIFYPRPSLAKA